MMPLRIFYNDLWRGKTLMTSSESPQYPAINTQHPHLSRVWRSTGCASEYVKIDAGVGLTVTADGIALLAHNLTTAGIIGIAANSVDAWVAPPFSIQLNARDVIPAATFLSQAYRYWLVTLVDPANPAGYVQLGRVFLCVRFEGETIDRGFRVTLEDSSAVSESLTGQVYADIGVLRRVYILSLGTMRNATKIALLSLASTVRQYDPVIVMPAEQLLPGSEEGIEPLYACMSKAVGFTEAGGWGWKDDALEFREAK